MVNNTSEWNLMNLSIQSVRAVVLLACFVLAIQGSTGEPAPQDSNRQEWIQFWEKRPPFTTADASAPVTFTADCPMVQMQLNGKPAIKAMIDTGGAGLYIKPEVATRLGLTLPAKGIARADTVKAGTLELKNIHFMTDWPEQFNPGGMEAVVGASMLCEFRLTMDYEHKQVIFGARTKLPAVTDEEDGKRRQAVQEKAKSEGALYVQIVSTNQEPQPFAVFECNGAGDRFGLDTGYTFNVIKKETADRFSLKAEGGNVKAGTLKSGGLSLNDVAFTLNSSPNVPNILGEAFLKRYRKVTFDFVNRDVLFYPAK